MPSFKSPVETELRTSIFYSDLNAVKFNHPNLSKKIEEISFKGTAYLLKKICEQSQGEVLPKKGKTMTVEQRKRARKVINRGGRNYRILVPSAKNKTMIHCESNLEAAAARLFEQSTIVGRYSEQPIVIEYEFKQQIREYYPDFLIWVEEIPIYVEIKPESQIKTLPVKEKLYALKKHFIDRQVHFMVLSEVTIKAENAEQLFALKADLLLMEGDNNDAF